jgi:hypothetical protein
MNQNEFEDTLRQFLRAAPFHPFTSELSDGRTLAVDGPSVAFDDGGRFFRPHWNWLILPTKT